MKILNASLLLLSWMSVAQAAPDATVASDGSGDFKTVQEAIDAITTNDTTRAVIFIKSGTYKEKIKVPEEKRNLTLMGESYESTILTYDDHAKTTKDYASTRVYADDFYAENLTFQNTIDSREGGSQAAALRVDGDRAMFYQCRITGFQDTYYTGGNKRSYHKACIIEGTTDFIYGNGIALFEDCVINNRKDSHITAHNQKLKDGQSLNKFGYVFKNCQIKLYQGEKVTKASLGRPWGNGARVAYLHCSIGSHIRKEGWSIWNRRTNHETAYYAEYKNTGSGSDPASRLDWTHQLTDEEAAEYTKENIFKANTTTATDLKMDWNPVLPLAKPQASALPAFPGAEGYGSTTPGGRGGKVLQVTTLKDSGEGSLRAAVETEGARIVVFQVSGTIPLESDLVIKHPNITIAGQTAPGDGICLKNYKFMISADDVVVRHLRIRRGLASGKADDCLAIDEAENVIVDHCSLSWGTDETLNTWHGAKNFTIQWCLVSEGLHHRGHGFAASLGGVKASYHHNLLANCPGRNPSIAGNDEHQTHHMDYRNNVTFNWGHRTADGKPCSVNIVNNYFKPGVNSRSIRFAKIDDASAYKNIGIGKWHIAGNFMEGEEAMSTENRLGVKGEVSLLAEEPVSFAPVKTVSAQEAYPLVLADVGATLPKRDSVDARVLEEVRTGKNTFGKGVVLDPEDVGGWPELSSTEAPLDSDADGMPDAWEKAHGLSPTDASDGTKDRDGDGYTNVEEYLNGLAAK